MSPTTVITIRTIVFVLLLAAAATTAVIAVRYAGTGEHTRARAYTVTSALVIILAILTLTV